MKKVVCVWDAPNIDRTLAEYYGGDRAPTPEERPQMGIVMNWLLKRAGSDDLDVCVFTNVNRTAASNPSFHGWLNYLRSEGFMVFAKPKDEAGQGDIDDDMLAFIRQQLSEADVREVLIASHDAQCFLEMASELLNREVKVTLLGYADKLGAFAAAEGVEIVDLESVPNAISKKIPGRSPLFNLPSEGLLMQPFMKRRRVEPEAAEPDPQVLAMSVLDLIGGSNFENRVRNALYRN